MRGAQGINEGFGLPHMGQAGSRSPYAVLLAPRAPPNCLRARGIRFALHRPPKTLDCVTYLLGAYGSRVFQAISSHEDFRNFLGVVC
jgi:hypothetical protein